MTSDSSFQTHRAYEHEQRQRNHCELLGHCTSEVHKNTGGNVPL